jgi:orotidine-5'-phosphate decarboxylase
MDRVTRVLLEAGKIDDETRVKLTAWLELHPSRISNFALNEHQLVIHGSKRKTFAEICQLCHENSLTARICDIISRKKSNLCVAVDFESRDQVLEKATLVAPYICILKIHVDIMSDFSFSDFILPLKELAQKHDFVILEDRKFADIGNVVKFQYSKGIHRINEWADLVTSHVVPGPDVVSGLKTTIKGIVEEPRGCLLIGELSSKGQLLGKSSAEAAFNSANENADFVVGFISQNRITNDPRFLHFTPGVSSSWKGDSLGQQYRTPTEAIRSGADVIICGRSIFSCENPGEEAQRVGKEAYEAFMSLTQ